MGPAAPGRIDPLTGLPTREHLLDRLDVVLARQAHDPATLGVLYVDLDALAEVNTNGGVELGDRVLAEVADRIDRTIRTGDVVGRWASDAFLVVFASPIAPGEAIVVAERILAEVRSVTATTGLTASVGLAFTSGERTASELVDEARAARDLRRAAGGDGWAVFDDELRTHLDWGRRWAADLRAAIDRDEFELLYQPIVDLGSRSVAGYEALVRWVHPTEGTVDPGEFVPLAERLGLAAAMGERVLRRAVAQLGEWSNGTDAQRRLGLSVNLSPDDLTDTLAGRVAGLCEHHGADPHRLRFELTETAVMGDIDRACSVLGALREFGAEVALDDFGTGHASLAILRDLPVDVVKIDQSFVSRLPGEVDTSIVRFIVGLAHELGLRTVAEGIETDAQLEVVRSLGCDLGQGMLFGGPAAVTPGAV